MSEFQIEGSNGAKIPGTNSERSGSSERSERLEVSSVNV